MSGGNLSYYPYIIFVNRTTITNNFTTQKHSDVKTGMLNKQTNKLLKPVCYKNKNFDKSGTIFTEMSWTALT